MEDISLKVESAPVLIIFFNRPNTLKKVFDVVRTIKPKTLLLYQDGPRNEKEIEKVLECRKIVTNVDWDCDLHTFFQEKNVGCDPSEYLAQKWAFTIVDKCIILEDDDVPSKSFFGFCTTLLDKYQDDQRISIISGMNHFGTYNEGSYDYFFTKNISIWGWATWKRVVESWDVSYTEYVRNKKLFKEKYKHQYPMNSLSRALDNHIASGREHYETILIYNHLVNNQLAIVPTRNLIINIGNNPEGGTHSSSNIKKLPSKIQKIFTLKTYDIENLRQNNNVVENKKYSKKVYKLMGWDRPITKLFRHIEVAIRKIFIR